MAPANPATVLAAHPHQSFQRIAWSTPRRCCCFVGGQQENQPSVYLLAVTGGHGSDVQPAAQASLIHTGIILRQRHQPQPSITLPPQSCSKDMENAEPLARVGLKTLKCILCHQVTPPPLPVMPQMVLMSELPPTQYVSHLSKYPCSQCSPRSPCFSVCP